MINPLKTATDGYLKRQTKAVLIIAVAGWLNFSGTPTPPNPPSGGGGYTYGGSHNTKQLEERKKKIKQDEQEWMLFIKIFTEQCL